MSFSVFSLNPLLEQAIRNCGFTAPPSIPQQAISSIIERHDHLGLAQTMPGKAAAFALPTVQHLLETPGKEIRVFILALTRELAEQINEFVNTIIRNTRLRCVTVSSAIRRNGRKQHPAFGREQRTHRNVVTGMNLLAPQVFLDLPGDLTN